MKHVYKRHIPVFILLLLLGTAAFVPAWGQACDASTPSFTFDLTGKPDSIWRSPNISRSGLCCGLDPDERPPARCIEFYFTLDKGAVGINFKIASGAIPSGSLEYQIGCGPRYKVGDPICLDGPGPHRLTFCKPGNNPNTYTIESIAAPKVSDPVYVSDGCRGVLSTTGYDPATIRWTSVPFNATHNSYLNCTSGCPSVIVTAQAGYPDYVDYQVTGKPLGGCASEVKQFVRAYFISDKKANILPKDPVICFGGTAATLTAFGTGGAPPYTYKWSTGATTQTIQAGIGKYWVEIRDASSCPMAMDSVTVVAQPSPIRANAGPDLTSCVNNPRVTLGGQVEVATGGEWTGGNGTFSPNRTTLNATYTPTAAEITAGSVTLTLTSTGNGPCPPVSDQVLIRILPAPIVNAGPDKTVCANNAVVTLTGTVSGASGGTWSGGSGTFSSNTSLTTTYTPSAAEKTAGTVTLTLTSTGNGTCLPVSDQVRITITPAPTINAGPDQTVCGNNSVVTLSGAVTVASGGSWTGGTGTFAPNRNTLNATYTPSAAERTAGTVTLTLTSTGNGTCTPVSDQVLITITPAPTINAGPDQTVCGNNSVVTLNGAVTVASGGSWTGGTGTFAPNRNTLNATYTPSAAEVLAGSVTLTLTSTGNGTCIPVSDDIKITITPAPTINAGPDQTVCANNAVVAVSGIITVASGGSWTTSGSGTFTDSQALTTFYTPSAADTLAGSVTLTLTTTGNGDCLPVSDNLVILIQPAPVVDAGADRIVCADNATVILAGKITHATEAAWVGGLGTFLPNRNALNATYIPTNGEIAAGSVVLSLTASRISCNPVSDEMTITITSPPVANAGPDQTVCANPSLVYLNATVKGATGGQWSGGTGTFTPNAQTLNATYQPSAAEITAGKVILTLTTTGNGGCMAVSDDVEITITPAPTIHAGLDQTVCGNNSQVTLNGAVTVASGGAWTGGTGSFSPNRNALNATYTPSAAEILAGTVTLTLTSTGNGSCTSVNDEMQITITPAPTINAGPDQTVCADNSTVSLSGVVTIASGGIWTSAGTGSFAPDASALNAIYTPSAADISAGTVVLTLTSTGNGLCKPVSDQVIVTITPPPTVDAGSDQTVCGAATDVPLNGVVTTATGGHWTTQGTGAFFPDANALNAVYQPSAADKTAGLVTLSLTTTGNGGCLSKTDDIVITFTAAPSINAGPDQLIVCTSEMPIRLMGEGSPAVWSGGDGVFFPDASTLNATYMPTTDEIIAGKIVLTLTTTANNICSSISDQIEIVILPGPVISTTGSSQTVCADVNTVSLQSSVIVSGGGNWNTVWTTSGSGTFADASDPNTSYTLSTADKQAGIVTLTLTSTDNGNCKAVSDRAIITITRAPQADAGLPQTVCANNPLVRLDGMVWMGAMDKPGRWLGGTGTFTPDRNSLNATYLPSDDEITAGTVTLTLESQDNGTCMSVTNDLTITITPAPVVSAGANQTACADAYSVALNGSVSIGGVSKPGIWSTSGTGSFSDRHSPFTVYYPSESDRAIPGGITLTLASDDNGNCLTVTSSTQLDFSPAPIADAGADQTVCEDVTQVSLSGQVTHATGGTWTTSGTGSFSSPNTLATDYQPSDADKAAGFVILSLSTTGQYVSCAPAIDPLVVQFSPGPKVDASSDQTICYSDPAISLVGNVTVAQGGTWSTTGTGTLMNPNQLLTTYLISDADRQAGSVHFTLRASLSGCNDVTDEVIYTISPIIQSDAGSDQTVCADVNTIQLAGTFTTATGGTWTHTGTGTLSDNTDPAAVYTLSAADKSNGKVVFTFTTTGNGTGCKEEKDEMVLTITPAPTVFAGEDQMVCANNALVSLSGQSTVATAWQWTTSGTGTFSQPTSLTTTYTPSAQDTTAHSVVLTLTTTASGSCQPVSDQLTLLITPAPVVLAGADQTQCADIVSVALLGHIAHAGSGKWATSGSGSFFPDASQLNAQYFPSQQDKTAGQVTLTLHSDGNGDCLEVTDAMQILFNPVALADAGADQTVCEDAVQVNLTGTVTNATGGTWSGPNGVTGFADPNQLSTTYTLSAADKVVRKVTLTFTTSGQAAECTPATDEVTIYLSPGPVVDAGPDATVCFTENDFQLLGKTTRASGAVWTTTGTGTFTSNTDLTTHYQITAADKAAGTILFTLRASLAGCNDVLDEMELTISPEIQVSSGTGQTVCADVNQIAVSGNISGITQATWSTSGTGTFADANTLSTSYQLSDLDKANGSVQLTLTSVDHGTCLSVQSTTLITITPAPTVFAGEDQTVCANNALVSLSAQSTIATAWQWTTSGTGTFSQPTSLTTTYTPSAQDTTAHSVVLTLTTTASGSCQPVSDQLTLLITPAPVVLAGADQTQCADIVSVALLGHIAHAGSGKWATSGSGSFFPDASQLNAQYFPSQQDKTAGQVTLQLVSTDMGTCLEVSDQMTIVFNPVPTADAGPATICADATGVQLQGQITVATAAVWSAPAGSTGTFTPNAQTLNAVYHPSASEISAGMVQLTLTTTAGNGACSPASDVIDVTITPTPTVNAGSDQTECADIASIALQGQITVSGQAIWSTSGGGRFIPNAITLQARYEPSAADIAAGKATLTLTTTDNGTCLPVQDEMILFLTPAPTAYAGPDQKICADHQGAISLSGKVTVATGGTWTTSGTGSFTGGASNLNTSYLPSEADKLRGKVTLTLTTTGNGTCRPVSSQMDLVITPRPTAYAGEPATICGDQTADLFYLNGIVTHATGGTWTTTGTGTFSASNALQSIYKITAADRAAGQITFTLTTTGNGLCNPVTHSLVLRITPPPVVEAGPDQTVCANVAGVDLNGQVTIATGGLWTTNGTGMFLPNAQTLNATYRPSAADLKKGSVQLTLNSTGHGTCIIVTDSVKIRFIPVPVLAGEDKWVCAGSSTQISTTLVPGATYQWTHNGTAVGGNSHQLTVTASKEETYIVRVTDVTTCVTADTIVVRTIPPPQITLKNVPACIGQVVTLNATPANATNAPASYVWEKDGVKLPQTTASIEVTTPGQYKVTYTVGECVATGTSVVSFHEYPITDMTRLIKFCKESDEKATLDAGPGARYLWMESGNTGRKEEVYTAGTYHVRVYNEFNCYTLDSIVVEDVCPPRLFVPSAFKPNGDGEDDRFDVFGAYFKDFEMTIFNRWGEIIFYTRDRYESWDGTYRGEPMPIGVYAWTINYRAEFKDFDEGMQRMKGSVTVLR
jgi:gliding motility-associated-like protein